MNPPKKGTTTMTPTKQSARQVDVAKIPLAKIKVKDGFNPRTLVEEVALNELADSIRDRGLLEALGVSPMGKGEFQLISGHRRHAAATRAGLKEVPCTIRDADETERLVDAIASNQHREDLTPLDEALAFGRLKDQGLTNKGIAEQLKVSERLVADRLVIAGLPAVLQERFRNRWPVSLARVLADMCKLSGGEALATVVADRIDASDGSVARALENLRHDPVSYVGALASTFGNPIPGVVSVNAVSGNAGGGFKGGPRWGVWSRDDLDPADLGKLPKATMDKLNVLRKSDNKRDSYNKHYYRLFLDQAALDSLHAANVLYRDDKSYGVCIQLDALAAVCEPIIDADYTAFLKAESKQKRVEAKGPEAMAAADQKAKEAAKVTAAREFNLQLGDQLATHFAEVDLNLEHTRLICRMAIIGAAPENDVRYLVERGLRYVVPSWHQEITVKSTGGVRHRYPGEGTKNPTGEDTNADRPCDELFWEWWNLAQTPTQVVGRTVQAIAAAMYAKQDAVPQSRRAYRDVRFPADTGRADSTLRQALEKMVSPKLPKAGPPKKTPAQAKAAAVKGAATRAANAPATNGAKAARKDPKAAKALEAIKATPGIAIPELATQLGIAQNGLYRLLPALQNDNKIHKAGRGWYPGAKPAPAAA